MIYHCLQRYSEMTRTIKLWKPCLLLIMLLFAMTYAHVAAKADTYIYGESQSMGIADEQGIILPPEYYIYENALSFVFCDTTGKWGFYDKASGFLQKPAFDHVYDGNTSMKADLHSPILVADQNFQIAYLERTNGKVIIPFQYQYFGLCSEFCNGYAVVLKGDESCKAILIDEAGNEITFPDECTPCSFVYNGRVVISKEYVIKEHNTIETDYKYGLGLVDGSILLSPKYDYIADFCEGYASIKQDGKWGHIDDRGNEIVAPTYELLEEVCGSEGYYFEDGVAELLLVDETVIYIDHFGNVVDVPNPRQYSDYFADLE